jgi:hypothetical protein
MLNAARISEAEFTALSIIATLSFRFPGNWLGAKRTSLPLQNNLNFLLQDLPWKLEKNIEERLIQYKTLGDLFTNFALKSTPEAVNRSLLSWSTRHYPLILFFTIPSPEEVLAQQTQGRRCVTVMVKEAQLKRYILGERDSLSFTMHDLIHADHFYFHNEMRESQVAFYNFLKNGLSKGLFEEHLKNEDFCREFDYLISDMNAYPIHLLKCLKAALIHYQPPGYNFDTWVKKLGTNAEVYEAFSLLNSKVYEQEIHDEKLLSFFTESLSAR